MGVNRIFVHGDVHGNFEWIADFCRDNQTTTSDVLVLLGDSGILYGEKADRAEQIINNYLSSLPVTILDIQGNHACPPEDRVEEGYLKTLMKIDDEMIGIAYQQFNYPNIYHAINGNTYYLAGHPCLVVGGATSVDKEWRQLTGNYWTEHEIPSLQDMNNILHQIHTRHFDAVFTHTVPYEYMPRDAFMASVDQSKEKNEMEHYLTRVKKEITYDHWYAGHWHIDRDNVGPNMTILFNETREIFIKEG